MRIWVAAFAVSTLAAATAAFAAGDLDAVLGKALFERDWVPAPASTEAANGLGPLFAARSCAGCHGGKDLAARFIDAPEGRIAGRGLVLRFGDASGRPDPLYGHMLQTQAVQGMLPEGRVVLAADAGAATGYDLSLTLDRGALDPATRQSVRLAPPIVGRAMLERIDMAAVLALADPDDANGDGISGRPHLIKRGNEDILGRYGWKADNVDIDDQVADAFAIDIGLSSRLRPLPHGDCTAREADCMGAPTGESARLEGYELSAEMTGLVATYLRSLPAPKRASGTGAGAHLFAAAGCAACHVPALPGSDGGTVAAYSDLLLHDMGPALDDGVGSSGVASAEWRTAPLIGMQEGNGRRFMHDGRAATLDAAIRAHGGEAEAARVRYAALNEEERAALAAFVGGL